MTFLLGAMLLLTTLMQWGSSPEAAFMTRDEQREWALVKTDDEAERFVAAFRARRNRDFAAEVEKRAKMVDERLALGEARPSATLRGRIVLVLGPPAEIRVRAIPKSIGTTVGHPLDSRKGGATDGPPKASGIGSGAGRVEYTFVYAANPKLGIGPEGWTVVLEADGASGKDRLKYRRDRKRMEDILDAAARTSFPID